jgi:hypothetical protein
MKKHQVDTRRKALLIMKKKKAAFHVFLDSINNYRALVYESEEPVSKNVMTFKWMMLPRPLLFTLILRHFNPMSIIHIQCIKCNYWL